MNEQQGASIDLEKLNSNKAFVAKRRNEILGVLVGFTHRFNENEYETLIAQRMLVDPTYRSKQVGIKLMQAAQQEFREILFQATPIKGTYSDNLEDAAARLRRYYVEKLGLRTLGEENKTLIWTKED